MKYIDSKSIFSGMVIFCILVFVTSTVRSQDALLNYQQFGPFSIALLDNWSFSRSESTDELFVFRDGTIKVNLKKSKDNQDINKAIIDITNNLRTSGEFIEQRRPSAVLSFLGLTQSQLLTIKSRSTGVRRFVFLPVVNSAVYEIGISDPSAGSEPANDVMYFISLIYLTADQNGAQNALASSTKWKAGLKRKTETIDETNLAQNKNHNKDINKLPSSDATQGSGRDPVKSPMVFTPPEQLNLKPYELKKTDVPLVKFSASDPCASENKAAGMPWEVDDTNTPLSDGVDFVTPPKLPDFENLSKFNYCAAVSLAFEGLRLVYGPLQDDEVEKFEASWAPLFDYPTQEIIDYLNKLNPLISRFLSVRETYLRNLNDIQTVLIDAAIAVEEDDQYAWEATMAEAGFYSGTLKMLEGTLNHLAKQIEALGNPPDPIEAKCAARKKYKQMLGERECSSPLDGEWVGYSEGHDYLEFENRQPVHLIFYSMPMFNPIDSNIRCTTQGFSQTDHTFAYDPSWAVRSISATDWDAPVKVAIVSDDLINGMSKDLNSIKYKYQSDLFNNTRYTITVNLKRVTKSLPPADRGTDHAKIEELAVEIDTLTKTINNARSFYDREPDKADENDAKSEPLYRESPEYRKLVDRLNICKASYEKLIRFHEGRPLIHHAAQIWLNELPLKINGFTDQGLRIEAFTKIVQSLVNVKNTGQKQETKVTTKQDTIQTSTNAHEKQIRKDAIAFHTEMVNIIKVNLDRDIADISEAIKALSQAKTPVEAKDHEARIKELNMRILHHQSNIQIEQDLVKSFETGQVIRTRTVFDEYAHQTFIQNIRENAARLDATRRIADRIERQINLLPVEIRSAARERARKQISPEVVFSGDIGTARKLSNSIADMVKSYAEYDHAVAKEAEVDAEQNQMYAQMAIMAIGTVSLGLGSAALVDYYGAQAAMAIYGTKTLGAIYGGVTGLWRGGPKEGVTEAVSYWSPYGYAATQFIEGFQQAGYQKDATMSGKVWEGVKQAGTGYLIGKAFELGTGLVAKGSLVAFGKDSRLFKPLVMMPKEKAKLMLDGMRTQQQVLNARDEVRTFRRLESELAILKRDPVSNHLKIEQMEKQLNQLAAGLNASYYTKWQLKYKADPLTRSKFDRRVQKNYTEMTPGMKKRLEQQGYDMEGIEFVQFRNASSSGSSSMDLDLGPVLKGTNKEPGKMIYGRKVIVKKDGSTVSLQDFMDDAQKAMNAEYRQQTGMSAQTSDMNLVTSVHKEAFASPRLLSPDMDFSTMTPQELASVRRVLRVKMEGIDKNKMLTQTSKMQAKAREANKEVENMLLKKLRSEIQNAPPGSPQQKQLQTELKYWEDMASRLREIGTDETNPARLMELNREIMRETGGRDVNGVVNDLIKKFTQ